MKLRAQPIGEYDASRACRPTNVVSKILTVLNVGHPCSGCISISLGHRRHGNRPEILRAHGDFTPPRRAPGQAEVNAAPALLDLIRLRSNAVDATDDAATQRALRHPQAQGRLVPVKLRAGHAVPDWRKLRMRKCGGKVERSIPTQRPFARRKKIACVDKPVGSSLRTVEQGQIDRAGQEVRCADARQRTVTA